MGHLDSADTLSQLSTAAVYEVGSNDIIGRRLPFGSLDRHQLRKVLCLPVELGSPDFGHRQRECRSTPKGNYMASATLTYAKKSVRCPRSLEAVLELPHELVFEIFEFLHPIDLYHMMLATKCLRRFLLDRRSALVWERVFLRNPGVPECPEDVSFPKWVSLLFGPATCDKCGYPNVLVNFAYRRRLCQICMSVMHKSRDGLALLAHGILADYPEAQEELWDLVRYSNRSSSYFYPPYDSEVALYLEEDVRERAEEMKAFLLAIEAGDANAQEQYQTFKSKTAATTLAYNEHAIMCNDWATTHFHILDADFEGLVIKFENICLEQLLYLDYDHRDISNIRGLSQYLYANCKRTYPSRFARKGYRCHLPTLEKMVLLAKNERLAVEYTQRVEARGEEVATSYHDTKVYIDPAHWQHLPKNRDIQQLAFFANYIRSDPEPLGEQCIPVDAGRSAVLGFVDKWIKEKRAHLREILEKARPAAFQASQYEPVDVLDLATAVFLCRPRVSTRLDPTPCPALIGWDAVGPHLLCSKDPMYVTQRHPAYEKCFQFCGEGYHTVIQLLALLNLDPLVTTAKDLDKLNARFICSNTSATNVDVMTWRECVNHVSQANPPALTFSVVTEEATQSVLFHEALYPHPGDTAWSCRRCTEYLKNPTTRRAVISHLKLIHGISTPPVENIDFFYLQPRTLPERKRFFISQEEGTSHRCARCKHPSNLRIWGQFAVLQHLNDKHKISKPMEGVDFTLLLVLKKTEQ